jgi:hypothetical protein
VAVEGKVSILDIVIPITVPQSCVQEIQYLNQHIKWIEDKVNPREIQTERDPIHIFKRGFILSYSWFYVLQRQVNLQQSQHTRIKSYDKVVWSVPINVSEGSYASILRIDANSPVSQLREPQSKITRLILFNIVAFKYWFKINAPADDGGYVIFLTGSACRMHLGS